MSASDGRFEIDIDCVPAGCFPGDNPGFPVEIVNRGSYVLTSNLDGIAMMGSTAIQVSTSSVSIDLNGFYVSGIPPMGLGVIVISQGDVEVKNGTVVGSGGGIYGGMSSRLRVDNVVATAAQGIGINLPADDNQVTNSVVTNSGEGIVVGARGTVSGCRAILNTPGDGIRVFNASRVVGNLSQGNTGDGIDAGTGSIVRDNVVSGNMGFGINLDDASLVIGNLARANGTNIDPCAGCLLVDNHTP